MATKTNLEELENFLDEVSRRTIDFRYVVKDNYVLIEYMSDLGEDVCYEFNVDTIDELVDEVRTYAFNFDADEHAEMWYEQRGKHGAPTSLRALLNDADKQAEDLDNIADAMIEVREELKRELRHE